MKRIAKILGAVVGVILICACVGAAWLWFYTADLPTITQLEAFAPASETQATLVFCDGTQASVMAMPVQQLGPYTLAALKAAEGEPDSRSPYVAVIAGLSGHEEEPRGRRYSARLALELMCDKSTSLRRHGRELRIAHAIQRKYNAQQILTMYLNRGYVGKDTFGIEAGANKYFGKHASSLSLSESACLVGLLQRPSYLLARPKRAVERRNRVLDEMVKKGSITQNEADASKSSDIVFQR